MLRRCPTCAGLHGPGECDTPTPAPCRACGHRHSPRLRCESAARLLGAEPQQQAVVDLQVLQVPQQPDPPAAPVTERPKTNAERQAAWRANHREKARELDRQRKRARKGPTA
jgi:hypothetical protein